ncbi:LacI family DNA-binding transcriptional regulator [Primorskyibacter sp. S187A]|uniref:LacI family DNA-binding transcriptional regulator n=1 Tax=Primorskyibacter sp. S187A TaxID=3415130 RepID=UPI003C7C7859
MGRVTASDVARAAGVSQPTVSRVFNRSTAVDPGTAKRVRAAAQRLGYIPNLVARTLNSGRSYRIGVILAHLNNNFFAAALQDLSKALNAQGYSVTVYFAGDRPRDVDSIVSDLLADQVDGIVLASTSLSNHLVEQVQRAGIPCVLFNRGQPAPGVSVVTTSNLQGGYDATEFLIRSGHSRIAHLAGLSDALNGQERRQGFLDAMADHGLTPLACVDCHFRREIAMEQTRALMAFETPPDAIFAASDHMAFGVLEVLRVELGLSVPGDVSVVGYDDAPMASWAMFDLTTIRQPMSDMIEATVRLLHGPIQEDQRLPQNIVLPAALVVRGSTRPPLTKG